MTLEQEYIKKIKLNLGKISKHIEVSMENNNIHYHIL